MRIMKMLAVATIWGVLIVPAELVWAQSADSGIVQKGDNPYAEEAGYDPYSAAHLKFDVLESQLQTLRKKMQVQAHKKAYATEEWNKHYETVKKHIEAWENFQDEYGIE